MKPLTKIFLIAGGIILLNNIRKSSITTNLGGYGLNNELAEIWGKRILYTSIPSLGFAEAILKSAKHLYNMNNMKGVNWYGK